MQTVPVRAPYRLRQSPHWSTLNHCLLSTDHSRIPDSGLQHSAVDTRALQEIYFFILRRGVEGDLQEAAALRNVAVHRFDSAATLLLRPVSKAGSPTR